MLRPGPASCMRSFGQIATLGVTIAFYNIANSTKWVCLWVDATSRPFDEVAQITQLKLIRVLRSSLNRIEVDRINILGGVRKSSQIG